MSVREGIRQGSVLSCTCFMMAIININDGIPRSVNALLYVDDYAIYASGSVPHLIERRLQTALNNMTLWTNKTGFQFSPLKTVSMHICRKRNCLKLAPNLSLNNINIRTVEQQNSRE